MDSGWNPVETIDELRRENKRLKERLQRTEAIINIARLFSAALDHQCMNRQAERLDDQFWDKINELERL